MKVSRNNEILVIMPCYNDSSNLSGVLDKMRNLGILSRFDILVIDDGSKNQEQTVDICHKYGVKCIKFRLNLGYSRALLAGYRYGVKYKYSYIIQMDADGQHDISNIDNIADVLVSEDIDIVLGCRFLEHSGEYKLGKLQKLGFKWYSLMLRLFTSGRLDIRDVTTGLQGLSRKAFTFYAEDGNFNTDYPDSNVLLRMYLNGFNIKCIPALMHKRVSGSGMYNSLLSQFKYAVTQTWSTYMEYIAYKVKAGAVHI